MVFSWRKLPCNFRKNFLWKFTNLPKYIKIIVSFSADLVRSRFISTRHETLLSTPSFADTWLSFSSFKLLWSMKRDNDASCRLLSFRSKYIHMFVIKTFNEYLLGDYFFIPVIKRLTCHFVKAENHESRDTLQIHITSFLQQF